MDATEIINKNVAKYIDQIEQLAGNMSKNIVSTPKVTQQLLNDIVTIHNLALKAKGVFSGHNKDASKMFERVDGNSFKLATEAQKLDSESNITNAERSKMIDAFKRAGLDGNGRFVKKEQGLAATTQILDALGFNLDMVTADSIMGDKGSRQLIFRRKNDAGQDIFTEKPEIQNSRIVFGWTRMDGPTFQYSNAPSKFEIHVYAS